VLDIDSSESPTYGEQEGSAYTAPTTATAPCWRLSPGCGHRPRWH